jgi:hypothetical protein
MRMGEAFRPFNLPPFNLPPPPQVAGGRSGLSAFQLDIKVEGITLDIMRAALKQAHDGRAHILQQMTACEPQPRRELSPHAPVITMLRIDRAKIGALIGPVGGFGLLSCLCCRTPAFLVERAALLPGFAGFAQALRVRVPLLGLRMPRAKHVPARRPCPQGGKTIKSIGEATGATIEVEDNGDVWVSAPSRAAAAAAQDMVLALTTPLEAGAIFRRASGGVAAPGGGGGGRRRALEAARLPPMQLPPERTT